MRFELRVGPPKGREWHPWFAWRPIRIGSVVVWLEVIQRRFEYLAFGDGYYRDTDYRFFKESP